MNLEIDPGQRTVSVRIRYDVRGAHEFRTWRAVKTHFEDEHKVGDWVPIDELRNT